MMRQAIKNIVAVILIILVSSTVVFAADSEYRFTHNDHDTLIIGEIKSIENELITIQAVDYIVSVNDLSVNASKKQLRPETAIVPVTSSYDIDVKFKVGDYVIASLNKNGDEYVVAWGMFKVDNTDYQTLKVETYSPAISAVYTDFVNSGGVYTDYFFSGETVSRSYDGVETIIYQGAQTDAASTPQQELNTMLTAQEDHDILQTLSEEQNAATFQQDKADPVSETPSYILYIACGFVLVVTVTRLVYLRKKRR